MKDKKCTKKLVSSLSQILFVVRRETQTYNSKLYNKFNNIIIPCWLWAGNTEGIPDLLEEVTQIQKLTGE
jgi:hypothetical protein